ncbi:MAG: hypothetical protein HY722_03400 [Planctomycetes bacterium]|nr:hypothetical protein [Planctomycetota bacterium]
MSPRNAALAVLVAIAPMGLAACAHAPTLREDDAVYEAVFSARLGGFEDFDPSSVVYVKAPPKGIRFHDPTGSRRPNRTEVWAVSGTATSAGRPVALTVYVEDATRLFVADGDALEGWIAPDRALAAAQAHLAGEAPGGFSHARVLLHGGSWVVEGWVPDGPDWTVAVVRVDARTAEVREVQRVRHATTPWWGRRTHQGS